MLALRHCGAALLLVLAACSGNPEASGPKTPGRLLPTFGSQGPLHGLALEAEIPADAEGGKPRLSFTTADTEVTATVGLASDGLEEGSPPLQVDWYSWPGLGKRELLFSHSIAVGPGGLAYSQAVSPTGLAPGAYETVATLGEHRISSPWVVEIAPTKAPAGAGGASFALLSPLAQVGDEDWNVPDSGDSGWNAPEEPSGPPEDPGPCTATLVGTGFDPSSVVEGSGYFRGRCSRITLSAAMSGAQVELASRDNPPVPFSFVAGESELCDLPGGSDLPGAVVTWRSSGDGGTSETKTFAVPDFGELLVAMVLVPESTPRRVDPGTRISIRGQAFNTMPSLGVEKLDVFAGDELLNSEGNLSGTSSPEPSDTGRLAAINDTSYTVPQGAPPLIEICARALGFDGIEKESCENFYTGEVWEGTFTYDYSGPTLTCSVDYSVTLGVVEGEVSGDITLENSSCPGATSGGPVTGTKTDNAFSLEAVSMGAGQFAVPITGENRASATFSSTPEEIRVFDVTCVSCES